MSNILDAVNAQYAKTQEAASGKNFTSNEERLKKYFATILPQGVKSEERRIRILPTKDGTSPFKEVYYHELQVDGKWVKLYDPKQDGEVSPLNLIADELRATGDEDDRKMAIKYRARKFYILKIIDRDNEADGVKFWRFKHNSKNEGIYDKIYPIFRNKGDITDPESGRDLIISIGTSKANNGKEYSTVKSVIPEDMEVLHTDSAIATEWLEDELEWNDVYAKKSQEYLEIVAKGETPKWNRDTKGWYSFEEANEEAAETLTNEEATSGTAKQTMQEAVQAQDKQTVDMSKETTPAGGDDDLPF